MSIYDSRLLITGSSGYIGENLYFFLKKTGFKNIVLIDKKIKKKICNQFKIDLSKKKTVKNFFKNNKFDYIIHLAAISNIKSFKKNYKKKIKYNLLITKNIIESINYKTKFIISSSAAVYGYPKKNKINEKTISNPINSYGISKKITENYLKKKDNFIIFRFFNVIGTLTNNFDYNNSFSQKIFYKHKKKINKIDIFSRVNNNKILFPERDFIHIYDICRILMFSIIHFKKFKNLIINCGSGKKISIMHMVKKFESHFNYKFIYKFKNLAEDEILSICSDNKKLLNKIKNNLKFTSLDKIVTNYYFKL